MDLINKCIQFITSVRAFVRQIDHAFHKQSPTNNQREEIERGKDLPRYEVRAILSFDEETVRTAKAESYQQQNTQNSIKKATWGAVIAASIYALISLAVWGQMLHQSRTADKALRQSTEAFRVDERASIEIESMKLKYALPFPPMTGVGYEVTAKNFGKTVARDIVLRKVTAMDANTDEAIKHRMIQNAFRDVTPIDAFPKSLGPSVPIAIPFSVGGSAPQTYGKGTKQSIWHDYLIGRIDYSDAFGIPHWMTFCFVIMDAKGTIEYCETGNDEDRNPELPAN